MQHKLQYNTGDAMKENATQQWWYSTIMAANKILNTDRFTKMVHPDFLEKMVVGKFISLAQKINTAGSSL